MSLVNYINLYKGEEIGQQMEIKFKFVKLSRIVTSSRRFELFSSCGNATCESDIACQGKSR